MLKVNLFMENCYRMKNPLFHNLEYVERKCFSKHFLKSVHIEVGLIGLTAEIAFSKEEELKKAFEKLGFTESIKVNQTNFKMEIDPDRDSLEHKVIQSVNKPIGLLFKSQKPHKEIQIVANKVIFSDFSYKGFDDFKEIVEKIKEILESDINSFEVNKVGLRKINSIKIEPVESFKEACSLFNSAIFANIKSGLISPDSLKVHEEVTILEKDNLLSVLKFSISKLETPKAYEVNFDFDLVDTEKTNFKEVIQTKLASLNDTHFNLFMWAIEDKMIELMEA